MMGNNYILVDGKVRAEPDFIKWATWYEKADRKIALTKGDKYLVSTTFLGLDHSFGAGPPLLFETMVFPNGSWLEEDIARYDTLEKAKAGHAKMVKKWIKE